MSPSPFELSAMRQAIVLSAFGLGTTSPNPPVGCVILDATGQVVGKGYHERKGEPHAEANALAVAGNRADGGTAVVTLEPCNHPGRTPPCHQALIDAGIRRVLVAVMDPTSRGEGGAARLRQAGVEVEIGVQEDEARLVLGPWLTAQATGRPFVIWPHVVAAEGQVLGLTARPDVADLRAGADVVLHADGTVEESVPGSHGAGVLNLGSVNVAASPEPLIHQLYAGGARLVLLDADDRKAEPYLETGLIHRVDIYLPWSATNDIVAPIVVPTGYQLRDLCRTTSSLHLRAERLPAYSNH
jgi:diaminohydroxyphosphoribosylaminopyrimidine deaminase / 5-amino-6-(5-phosphoribosylamino)uracil reductase